MSPRNSYHLKWRYHCGFIFSIVEFVISLIGYAKCPFFFQNYIETLLFGGLRIISVTFHFTVDLCYDAL